MTERQEEPPRDPGFYSRRGDDRTFGPVEVAALGATIVWLAVSGALAFAGGGAGGALLTLVAVVLPVAVIWIFALTFRSARTMRQEAERLQSAMDAMRHAWLTQTQGGVGKTSVEKKLEEIAAAQKQTESALATFTSRRDALPAATRPPPAPPAPPRAAAPALPPPAPAEDQPALALGTPADALRAPVTTADLIRALNFPDSQDDREGFGALRRALADRDVAKLIRAAQDVLTLLSQDGIYMDDLAPDRARPEVWRRFAQGERGRGIAALGGVRDRSSLALTAARMRSDTVFRDAAHHFLRQFDRSFAAFEPAATDSEISDLADTRTARAFMLLGRVTGTFD